MTKQVVSTYYRYEELPPDRQRHALMSYGESAVVNDMVQISIDEDMKSLTAALESIGCKASEWEIDPGAERGSVTVVTKDNLEEDLSCLYGIDSDGHVAAIPDAESDGLFIGEGFKEDWLAKRAELQRKVDEINGRVDDINASGASGDERDALADELDRTLCWPLIDAYLAAAQECADRAVKDTVADGAYRYTEEALIEDCEANDYWFNEYGDFEGAI